MTFEHQRLQVGAGCVQGRRVSGTARTDNDYIANGIVHGCAILDCRSTNFASATSNGCLTVRLLQTNIRPLPTNRMKFLLSNFLKIAATLAICSVFVHAGEDTAKTAPSKVNPTASLTDCGKGNIVVEATPDRADILVDGSFAGNAP